MNEKAKQILKHWIESTAAGKVRIGGRKLTQGESETAVMVLQALAVDLENA